MGTAIIRFEFFEYRVFVYTVRKHLKLVLETRKKANEDNVDVQFTAL